MISNYCVCLCAGACIYRHKDHRLLLQEGASAVATVLQLVDGEDCFPAQELIKERVTPERLSNDFWPSWFDCMSMKIVLCWQNKGFSWP